ncbi:hypothetical protein DL764_009523 [Monosporascus ibericus]|uniref:SPIN90/Ldb17 leucine-rich domain-containing protein n=1 Tax=Monosporascus ibericus TaxID=155417 RepID=A0A4Q4SUQ2_9PEZI|nr:hypothetical protein DL764_009523 [Monosporascus ibericus]
MASPGDPGTVQNEEQLWHELEGAISTRCPAEAHETIDDALRTWLSLSSQFRCEFSESEDEAAYCSQRLLEGALFRTNPHYVRTQIIYSLLQEDEGGPLYAIATCLLLDGRGNEATFRRMIDESCFPRLLELIVGHSKEEDPGLHRLLLDLTYEMSRIERLRFEDLQHVDDGFVVYLFQLIEQLSDDVNDPYHYPIIRVLLMLNEQYMIASTATTNGPHPPSTPLTNRVVKCLSLYGPHYRTFGENIILLLNRETETSLQLLILKLLYLLFTTKATYEYFYTNDLRVLLDVIIRNLLDLPNELMALRHTYLRVLYPLLAHTQLGQPPHYKKDEVQKVLALLAGSGNVHFAPADETTLRLVDRVSKVPWLSTEEGSGASEIARKLLGISLSPGEAASKTSVVDLAALQEKPGVQTPSRSNTIVAATEGEDSNRRHHHHHQHPNYRHHHYHHHGENGKGGSSGGEDERTTGRSRKLPPEVPKHRHGTPFRQTNESVVAPAHTAMGKRLPPKTPPPRRKGRLKSAAAAPVPDSGTGVSERVS